MDCETRLTLNDLRGINRATPRLPVACTCHIQMGFSLICHEYSTASRYLYFLSAYSLLQAREEIRDI